MNKWVVIYTWREDANKGVEKTCIDENIEAPNIDTALTAWNTKRPVNGRVVCAFKRDALRSIVATLKPMLEQAPNDTP